MFQSEFLESSMNDVVQYMSLLTNLTNAFTLTSSNDERRRRDFSKAA